MLVNIEIRIGSGIRKKRDLTLFVDIILTESGLGQRQWKLKIGKWRDLGNYI